MSITQSFVQLHHGQIHFRLKGDGPPLILLHQSPRSSSEYLSLIEKWSEQFQIIAPDTPGNGLSDALPGKPTMFDYADALVEFMDKLELKTVYLYGFHTGASIATAAASRYPHRIEFAIGNGLALLEEDQRRDFLDNYMPKIDYQADGSHLSWLWSRIQKQAKYFPWYSTKDKDRLSIGAYSTEKCQEILMDFLLAGNNYRAPYRAAFAFEPVTAGILPANNLCVCASKTDPLYPGLLKLPKKQKFFEAEDHISCEKQALDILKEKAAQAY